MDFYDEIASDYDVMTGSGDRSSRAEKFLKELATRFPLKSALDVACGTGMYSIILAKMGIETVGADLSEGMLAQAKRHAVAAEVSVEWVAAPMQELTGKLERRFDVVLCMGNSIPHLLSNNDLDVAIAGFLQMLNPNGIAVIQLLNYSRVLTRQERIVDINRYKDKEYVRFYDFLQDLVKFNILEIKWTGNAAGHQLHSTLLRPYTCNVLCKALSNAGFHAIDTFSDLQFAPFDANQSETLLLIAQKGK